MNTAPFEVIAAPYVLYVAPVGTPFPNINAAVTAPWKKVGKNGDLNYDRSAGVVLDHAQSTVKWRSAGDTGTRKIFRIEEDQTVSLKLVDVTLEAYALALNSNPVTSVAGVAGTPGYRKIGLSRGSQIATMAILIRGLVSPYGEDWSSQYEIPLAQQEASSQVALSKPGEPAGLDLKFTTLVDVDAASADERYGRLLAQDSNTPVGITSSSEADPTVITTASPHGFITGDEVLIAGHTSTPDINGTHTVTVTGASTFTIPVEVTAAGAGGTATLV